MFSLLFAIALALFGAGSIAPAQQTASVDPWDAPRWYVNPTTGQLEPARESHR